VGDLSSRHPRQPAKHLLSRRVTATCVSVCKQTEAVQCLRLVAVAGFVVVQSCGGYAEHRPSRAGVPASNSRDPIASRPAGEGRLTSSFNVTVVRDRLAACWWGPRRGAVRGMSSFREAFHESAPELVQSGNVERYAQVRRGAPGRIRTCAPASGGREKA
jgi:hypothetical protein